MACSTLRGRKTMFTPRTRRRGGLCGLTPISFPQFLSRAREAPRASRARERNCGKLIGVSPQRPPRRRVRGVNIVLRPLKVEHAIHHERRCLQTPTREIVRRSASGKSPDGNKIAYVLAIDLIQAAIAPRAVIAIKCNPILRLLFGFRDS